MGLLCFIHHNNSQSDCFWDSMEKTYHIAVLPSVGFGHLVPVLEFSKRLVQLHQNFHVTCIIPTLGSPPDSFKPILESIPSHIDSIFLPPIKKEDLPQGVVLGHQLQLAMTRSLPFIQEALKSLSSRVKLAALITDLFGYQALDFAKELKILSYIYFPLPAMALSLCLHLPKLDETVPFEYRNLTEPIELPGCVPLHAQDFPDSLGQRTSEAYKNLLHRSKQFYLFDGVLFNSFVELEPGAIRALQEGSGNPPVYSVGPIIQTSSSSESNGPDCLTWLDNQQQSSVLYVSFGSGGTLSQEQLNELALGLELSGQKFLWVVRSPSKTTSSAYLGAEKEDPLQFLPSGFLERTKEQGLVVPSWAPQVQVLSHSATGGFLTHCGWNSTLEGVVHGVPLIAWPLFAEQKMNAAMLTNGLKVAIRPKAKENGIVKREEVAMVVRSLIEGEIGKEIRKRMKELKVAAADAIKDQGSSTKTLSQLANKIKGL